MNAWLNGAVKYSSTCDYYNCMANPLIGECPIPCPLSVSCVVVGTEYECKIVTLRLQIGIFYIPRCIGVGLAQVIGFPSQPARAIKVFRIYKQPLVQQYQHTTHIQLSELLKTDEEVPVNCRNIDKGRRRLL